MSTFGISGKFGYPEQLCIHSRVTAKSPSQRRFVDDEGQLQRRLPGEQLLPASGAARSAFPHHRGGSRTLTGSPPHDRPRIVLVCSSRGDLFRASSRGSTGNFEVDCSILSAWGLSGCLLSLARSESRPTAPRPGAANSNGSGAIEGPGATPISTSLFRIVFRSTAAKSSSREPVLLICRA